MSELKCSSQHIQEYKNGINQYLITKGITDFSKYQVSFKKDKLHYIKWGYPDTIPKPTDIKLIPPPVNYFELYPRVLFINVKENDGYKTYNVDGKQVSSFYTDELKRSVQMILKSDIEINPGEWSIVINQIIIGIKDGNIFIDNTLKIKGNIHIIFLYKTQEYKDNIIQQTLHMITPEILKRLQG